MFTEFYLAADNNAKGVLNRVLLSKRFFSVLSAFTCWPTACVFLLRYSNAVTFQSRLSKQNDKVNRTT